MRVGTGGQGGRATVAVCPFGEPIRASLRHISRSTGLASGALVAVLVPAWSLVDHLLVPEYAQRFITLRLACLVPVLVVVGLLYGPPGRRHPELLTTALLGITTVEIAWMVPRAADVIEIYLLGLSLPLFGMGCLFEGRTRWTWGVSALTALALTVADLTAPVRMSASAVVAAVAFLGTAVAVAVVSNDRRYRLRVSELRTRRGLDEERDRTQVLLGRLERLSQQDSLTGLANRRRWDVDLAAACETARRTGAPVSVALVDLDHFKTVNDRYGHAVGDQALRMVADLLGGQVRATDLVARLGGDEMGVLLPGIDHQHAVAVAEALRRRADGLRLTEADDVRVTLSIGVATGLGAGAVPLDLTRRADEQLYAAKVSRNAVRASDAHDVEVSGEALV